MTFSASIKLAYCCGAVVSLLLAIRVLWPLLNPPRPHSSIQNTISPHLEFSTAKKPKCLNETPEFAVSMGQQKRGLMFVRDLNETLLLNETWSLIPVYFNKIWSPVFEMTYKTDMTSSYGDLTKPEFKYILPLSAVTLFAQNLLCNAFFLGIGETVEVERKLRDMYPKCNITGVDSSPAKKALLDEVNGIAFIQTAISGVSNGAAQIGIADLLNAQGVPNPVDWLMVDLDGQEFEIISQLVDFPAHLKRTICQLNFKVHTPQSAFAQKGAASRFLQQLDDWLESGRYALVHVDARGPDSEFMRLLLVDVEDPECRRKFLCD